MLHPGLVHGWASLSPGAGALSFPSSVRVHPMLRLAGIEASLRNVLAVSGSQCQVGSHGLSASLDGVCGFPRALLRRGLHARLHAVHCAAPAECNRLVVKTKTKQGRSLLRVGFHAAVARWPVAAVRVAPASSRPRGQAQPPRRGRRRHSFSAMLVVGSGLRTAELQPSHVLDD